ncbi:variant erythrocyte surface antigen-1 family protein [Babesia caballi]|uniref:Variant erythrocyte surface antigen-1 family protein n=1 Tax=Babesia caballi TaxID=5871 RepID=A0AAV4LR19_BABCB|nr:variant erythrocyte surface antigen-1 family protein [Babesia caballi]
MGNLLSSKVGSNGPYDSLTKPPMNLKESIDWVLRVCGSDWQRGKKNVTGAIDGLATAVVNLLQKTNYATFTDFANELINSQLYGGFHCKANGNTNLCQKVVMQNLIYKLGQCLSRFIGYDERRDGFITGNGIAIGKNGEPGEPWESITESKGQTGYSLAYNPNSANWDSTWQGDDPNAKTCAKNFMKAVIIIFEGLTKLYWGCRINEHAPWRQQQFKGAYGDRLYAYLLEQGFKKEYLNNLYMSPIVKKKHFGLTDNKRFREGAIINGILSSAFDEFGRAMAKNPPNNDQRQSIPASYPDFIKALINGAEETVKIVDEVLQKRCTGDFPENCTDCTKLSGVKAHYFFQDYHFTKLYILILAYKCFKDRSYRRFVAKTVGGVTCGAGIGAAAYFTKASGLVPIIAGFFS